MQSNSMSAAIGDGMLTPSKAADYIQKIETKLDRRVDRAVILPDGGIEVSLTGAQSGNETANPADLVDMSE
jgi:hypothetical protein